MAIRIAKLIVYLRDFIALDPITIVLVGVAAAAAIASADINLFPAVETSACCPPTTIGAMVYNGPIREEPTGARHWQTTPSHHPGVLLGSASPDRLPWTRTLLCD